LDSGIVLLLAISVADRYLPLNSKTLCWNSEEDYTMKTWTKPEVREQEVGLEVTSYLPAEIDLI
jgi:coenzyme PQQ precursor peptide PqqA